MYLEFWPLIIVILLLIVEVVVGFWFRTDLNFPPPSCVEYFRPRGKKPCTGSKSLPLNLKPLASNLRGVLYNPDLNFDCHFSKTTTKIFWERFSPWETLKNAVFGRSHITVSRARRPSFRHHNLQESLKERPRLNGCEEGYWLTGHEEMDRGGRRRDGTSEVEDVGPQVGRGARLGKFRLLRGKGKEIKEGWDTTRGKVLSLNWICNNFISNT